MSKLKNHKVTINGDTYLLITDEPQELIDQAALSVDKAIRQLIQKMQSSDSKKVATLVALQLASQNIALMKSIEHNTQYAQAIIETIDKVFYSIIPSQK